MPRPLNHCLPAVLVTVGTFFALPVTAQTTHTPNTLTLDGAPPAPATMADVAWLTGTWRGTGLGGQVEDVWMEPAGGAMPGAFRALRDGRVTFYEFVAIVEHEGSLLFRIKHFNADLTGWEEKDETQDFPLVRVGPDGLYFDGITYRREGEDRIRAFVASRQRDGTIREIAFVFERVRE